MVSQNLLNSPAAGSKQVRQTATGKAWLILRLQHLPLAQMSSPNEFMHRIDPGEEALKEFELVQFHSQRKQGFRFYMV
eukprot:1155935-Pelagomonas_calceolata.AAC.1